jgi:phage shock protein B
MVMYATSIEGVAPLIIPLAAIIGVFTVKALRIMRKHPIQADLTAEDRAKLRRITEMIEKMESRITVLETLLKDDQASREVTDEKAS